MAEHTDIEALARRLCQGHPAAFAEFALFFGPRIYKFLRNKGLADADATDLTATLITDIELKVDRYRFSGSFKNWVFRIVSNACTDWKREHGSFIPLHEGVASAELYEREFATNPDIDRIVQAAEARLPRLDREILQLRYSGVAFTFEEIGRHLGIKAATIRTRHQRALAKLQKLLAHNPAIVARNSSLKDV